MDSCCEYDEHSYISYQELTLIFANYITEHSDCVQPCHLIELAFDFLGPFITTFEDKLKFSPGRRNFRSVDTRLILGLKVVKIR
jgi:hypothetical protein